MSIDRTQMDRIEDMMTQLIRIVGSTNDKVVELQKGQVELQKGQASLQSSVAELQEGQASLQSSVDRLESGQAVLKDELSETKDTVYRIEHRLQVMERRQDKFSARLDIVETEVELIKEEANH